MIFHEISYLIFFEKLGKMSQNLSSAAAVIGALRVKKKQITIASPIHFQFIFYIKKLTHLDYC